MKPAILNRDFVHPTDGWYQIEVPGEHPNVAGGVIQVIDTIAATSIVNRFNQEAADYQRQRGEEFPGMLIDHEHFKHQADKETVAYGWLLRLENRQGIPFGQIRWTTIGQAATDGGEYRFFSTEYDPEDCQILHGGQPPARVRPLRLAGLTLTNDANNKGGRPITNRALPPAEETVMTPAQAGAKALEIANQIQAKKGWTFNEAWNYVRQTQPDLFNCLAADAPASAPAQTSTAAFYAGKTLRELAQAEQAARGGSFDQAWQSVINRCPNIVRIMNEG